MRNVLVVISGPSGVGKGTLVRALLAEDDKLVESVSCTTRAPRAGEVNGREYFFISKEEFRDRIAANDFLEYDEHFDNFYGRRAPLWSGSSRKNRWCSRSTSWAD